MNKSINLNTNEIDVLGVRVPVNLFHARPSDEDDTGKVAFEPKGGFTVAYVLRLRDNQLFASAAVAACSSEDNFVKRVGKTIALNRLRDLLRTDNATGLSFEQALGSLDSLGVDPSVFTPLGHLFVVTAFESAFPVQEILIDAAIAHVRDYKYATYEGDLEDDDDSDDDEEADDDDSDDDEDSASVADAAGRTPASPLDFV